MGEKLVLPPCIYVENEDPRTEEFVKGHTTSILKEWNSNSGLFGSEATAFTHHTYCHIPQILQEHLGSLSQRTEVYYCNPDPCPDCGEHKTGTQTSFSILNTYSQSIHIPESRIFYYSMATRNLHCKMKSLF